MFLENSGISEIEMDTIVEIEIDTIAEMYIFKIKIHGSLWNNQH